MSDFGNGPGGGFSSVDGYNDPAGSQAEEQRRMQEDELNRQRLEQAENDAAAQQAEQQAAYRQPNARSGDRRTSRSQRQPPQGTQKRQASPKIAQASRPVQAAEVSPGFAVIGFVAAGFWGLGLMEGDGRWFGGIVVGLVGAYVAGHYHKVLIAALLVGSGWWFLNHLEPSKSQPTSQDENRDSVPPSAPVVAVAEKVKPQTPEQEVEARYPYPAKPAILLRPHQDLITDPSRMRAFQKMVLQYEKQSGKLFLTDHRSIKPATHLRFDYVSRYGDGGLQEGLEAISDLEPIQGIWDYRSPQLWELDLTATVKQQFTYQKTYADGTIRAGIFRTYPGDGLCYQPMSRPLFRNGDQYEVFQLPVRGGRVWRDFVRSVYLAKTDTELVALDPINLAIAQTHKKTAQARSSYESQIHLVDGLREASLPVIRSAWKLQSSRRE